MDDRASSFIESLKNQLEGVPEEEIQEAISYYEEYLNDAAEAGKDVDEILARLGSPQEIAAMIRTEASIAKVQRNPGLKNFNSAVRYAFAGVTTPFAVLLLSICVALSYGIVAVFFAGAFAISAAAVVATLGLVYQAFDIPAKFTLEILGTLGLALFTAGVLLLAAYMLYKLGKLFIKISASMVGLIMKNPQRPKTEPDTAHPEKGKSRLTIVSGSLVIAAVGLVLFSVSGIPFKLFTIFNSMKPANITVITQEFEPVGVNKISILTAHSSVRLLRNTSGKIIISYEQPDWLEYGLGSSGGTLSFYEKSNGRLPLFMLVSLHESSTELTVSIPEGYSPELVDVESTGGYVYVYGMAENIRVRTYTGEIHLESGNAAGKFNIKGNTAVGRIEVDGMEAGQKTAEGIEYYRSAQSEKTIELRSSRGNINIKG